MTGFCVNLLNSKFYHPCSHGKDINLKLYLINVMSYKYILPMPNLSFIPATSLK